MIVTCPRCDARWTGTVVEHCTACHLTFGSTEAGDKHRVGEHGVREGPDRRRCLTVEEMRGIKIARGKLEGQLWFDSRFNVHGTEIWVRRKLPDTRWEPGEDAQNRRTDDPWTQLPENRLEAA